MTRLAHNLGLISKILTLVAGGLLLILGVMFSLVLIAVVAVVGLTAWTYLHWRTRHLRRAKGTKRTDGRVIEGESIVVEDSQAAEHRVLPGD